MLPAGIAVSCIGGHQGKGHIRTHQHRIVQACSSDPERFACSRGDLISDRSVLSQMLESKFRQGNSMTHWRCSHVREQILKRRFHQSPDVSTIRGFNCFECYLVTDPALKPRFVPSPNRISLPGPASLEACSNHLEGEVAGVQPFALAAAQDHSMFQVRHRLRHRFICFARRTAT